jgi:hypothetical protein
MGHIKYSEDDINVPAFNKIVVIRINSHLLKSFQVHHFSCILSLNYHVNKSFFLVPFYR